MEIDFHKQFFFLLASSIAGSENVNVNRFTTASIEFICTSGFRTKFREKSMSYWPRYHARCSSLRTLQIVKDIVLETQRSV